MKVEGKSQMTAGQELFKMLSTHCLLAQAKYKIYKVNFLVSFMVELDFQNVKYKRFVTPVISSVTDIYLCSSIFRNTQITC